MLGRGAGNGAGADFRPRLSQEVHRGAETDEVGLSMVLAVADGGGVSPVEERADGRGWVMLSVVGDGAGGRA